MGKLKALTDAVSDYFFGTGLKELYGQLTHPYEKSLDSISSLELYPYFGHIKRISKQHFENERSYIVGIHKKIPNWLDCIFIGLSIVTQNPKLLMGVGVGEVYRFGFQNQYNLIKRSVRKNIQNLEIPKVS